MIKKSIFSLKEQSGIVDYNFNEISNEKLITIIFNAFNYNIN